MRERDVAAHVHGESGPRRARPAAARDGAPGRSTRSTSSPSRSARATAGVTLVPTGPLTNIALLLALHPDARPERIVLMGGAIGEGNRTPAAEFNIWADPEAAQRVFASGLDMTMVGLDVTHRALVTDAHAERLRAAGRVGAMVAELMDFYSALPPQRYPELGGSPMHDPVASRTCSSPGSSRSATRSSRSTAASGPSWGRTNVDWRGREHSAPPNAKVGARHRRRRASASC